MADCSATTPPVSATSPSTAMTSASPTRSLSPGDLKKRAGSATLFLKKADDEYRQRLLEGHNYKVAGNSEYYDAWWSYLTQGMLVSAKLVDTAQYGYSQATDLWFPEIPHGSSGRQ